MAVTVVLSRVGDGSGPGGGAPKDEWPYGATIRHDQGSLVVQDQYNQVVALYAAGSWVSAFLHADR